MEFWSYFSGVKSQEGIDNQRINKLVNHNNQISDSLTSNIGVGRVFSSVKVPNSAFFDKSESSSKVLRSVLESNCEDSSLIDLKLGRFLDLKDAGCFKSPVIMANLSSNVPAKRMRTGGLNSQIPCCQVRGCGKDLRSSKDYHKRHKVCEAHSKTAKVIVNGIEQRFCQQCSRFHLLAEFDDGKRSCRKRLAGHNERRRKPHAGTRFRPTSFARSSSICQNILGSSLLHQPKYEIEDCYRNVKVGDATDYSPRLTMPLANGHSQPKSVFTSYRAEKQHPPLHDEGMTALTRSKIDKSSKSYLHDMGGSDFVTCSLLQSTSIGGKVLHVLDSSSAIQGLSGSCAFSLLSPQSQYSSNHSSPVPTAHHLRTPSSNAHHNVTCISEKLQQVIPQTLSSGVSGFNPAEAGSADDCLEQILVSNSSNNCGINWFIQGSEYVKCKHQ